MTWLIVTVLMQMLKVNSSWIGNSVERYFTIVSRETEVLFTPTTGDSLPAVPFQKYKRSWANFSFLPLDLVITVGSVICSMSCQQDLFPYVLSVHAFKDCTEEGWWKHPISNRSWSNYTTCVNTEHLEVLL